MNGPGVAILVHYLRHCFGVWLRLFLLLLSAPLAADPIQTHTHTHTHTPVVESLWTRVLFIAIAYRLLRCATFFTWSASPCADVGAAGR